MFENLFGHFIKKSQEDLINKMYDEIINNNTKQYTIQNFLMCGKSSVLSSVLTQLMKQQGKPFILIILPHFVKDAFVPLLQYRPLYRRNLRYIIGSMEEAKTLIIVSSYNYVLSDS